MVQIAVNHFFRLLPDRDILSSLHMTAAAGRTAGAAARRTSL